MQRRRWRPLLLALVASTTATACSNDGADADELARAAASTTDPPDDAPAASDPDASPSLAPRVAEPLAWTPRRPTSPTSTTLSLLIDEGGCDGAIAVTDRLAVSVVERSNVVAIGVDRVSDIAADRSPCPTVPLTAITVALESPLGDRTLVELSRPPLGPAPVTPDEAAELLALVTGSADAAAPAVAGSTVVDDTAPAVAPECSGRARTVPVVVSLTVEYDEPRRGLTDAADRLGRLDDVFHEFVGLDADRSTSRVRWVSADDGRPVAIVDARRGIAGWELTGRACPDGAPAIDAVVDAAIGRSDGLSPAERPPLLDPIVAIDAGGGSPTMPGVSIDDDGLRLVGDDRCTGWLTIEDQLLATGHRLGTERTVVDPSTIPAPTGDGAAVSVERQVERRVDGATGSAVLTTTPGGRVLVRRAVGPAPSGPSRLGPCRLDGETATVRLVAVDS